MFRRVRTRGRSVTKSASEWAKTSRAPHDRNPLQQRVTRTRSQVVSCWNSMGYPAHSGSGESGSSPGGAIEAAGESLRLLLGTLDRRSVRAQAGEGHLHRLGNSPAAKARNSSRATGPPLEGDGSMIGLRFPKAWCWKSLEDSLAGSVSSLNFHLEGGRQASGLGRHMPGAPSRPLGNTPAVSP